MIFVQAKTKKLNAQLACFKMGEDTLITLKTWKHVYYCPLKFSFVKTKLHNCQKPPQKSPLFWQEGPSKVRFILWNFPRISLDSYDETSLHSYDGTFLDRQIFAQNRFPTEEDISRREEARWEKLSNEQ